MVSLAELMECGVFIEAHEGIAIAQLLIEYTRSGADAAPPLGPPALDSVLIGSDGSVICRGCGATAHVAELALLLDAMLQRPGGVKMPGGLRYAIARALLLVDATPFGSLNDFSETLARYERGPRSAQVRELYARFATNARHAATAATFVERRRTSPRAAELRRRLREADEEQFYLLRAAPDTRSLEAAAVGWQDAAPETIEPPPTEGVARTPLRRGAIAVGLLAVLLSFAGAYAVVRQHAARPRVVASAAPAATADDSPSGQTEATSANDAATRDDPRPTPSPQPRPALRGRRPQITDSASIVRAAPQPQDGPVSSPATDGTALFFQPAAPADSQNATASADLGADLQMMAITGDGAKNYHVQPSPDGTRVAFDSDRDGERGVYVANRDGSAVRRISGSGYAAAPKWSPDSKRLAFVRAEPLRPTVWNLWVQTLETGENRRLTAFPSGQTWSASWFADGRRICYTHDDRLVVHDLDTNQTREFASPIRGRQLRMPAVSPDGRHVIFQVARSGAWLLDFEDGDMRCVLTDPTAEEFAWAPDGRRVAFHSRRDGEWGIWLMRPT